MCFPERSRFCIVCVTFYLLSWFPAEGHSHSATQDGTYSTSPEMDHKHVHLHDDHQIPKSSVDNSEREVEEQEYFIKALFEKYGKNGNLSLDGLTLMLKNIGIHLPTSKGQGHDHDHDHDLYDKKHDDHDHGTHEHNCTEKDVKDSDHDHDGEGHTHHTKCIGKPTMLLSTYHYNITEGITPAMFIHLCPAILTLTDKSMCSAQSYTHGLHSDHEDGNHDDHAHQEEQTVQRGLHEIPASVWGYSCVAVIIISLAGLLGVAVIPIMQKVFYNHLLQFLVALAVGALSGDALLHLIPHAFGGKSHSHTNHSKESAEESMTGVLKGLCGLMGIYVFFMMERLLTMYTESRKRKKRRSRLAKRNSATAISTVSKHDDDRDCGTAMLGIHPGARALDDYAKESQKQLCNVNEEEGQTNLNNQCTDYESDDPDAVVPTHHGHSHSHTHGKLVSHSVASIAWMVIIGDGIHNLSDGLAIGAAYSNSITGGISTSIAIFCHELPHEIGDFAVLLRAGMTVKQALVYNCVSSVLAFIGMIVGVMIGNTGSVSLWIFAMIGGMFLYIALVDMMPEITALDTKKGENLFCHLLLQTCGMLLGAGIMFLIAYFEHDLMTFLEN